MDAVMGRHCPSSNQTLAVVSHVGACGSFCCLFISVISNYWLRTSERVTSPNGTASFLIFYSGLWKKCQEDPGRASGPLNCSYVNYFTYVDRDGLGPTDSILLSLRRATPFPMVGLLVMLIAQTICFAGHCNVRRQTMTVVSGALYVAGGLLTLVGIIVYIGAITEEASSKSKPSDDSPFKYSYGPSLLLAIGSFVGSQLTGVFSINLYISRRQEAYQKEQEIQSAASAYDIQPSSGFQSSAAGNNSSENRNHGNNLHQHQHQQQQQPRANTNSILTTRSETLYTIDTSVYDGQSMHCLQLQSPTGDASGCGGGGGTATASMMTEYVPSQPQLLSSPQDRMMGCFAVSSAAAAASDRTMHRPILCRDWSEASTRSNLSREWSRCSTEELDTALRRITPV